MDAPLKLGVLGSTKGTDLQAIIEAIENKKLNASIEIVISNNDDAYILQRAAKYTIPHFYITHKNKLRVEFDSQISDKLKEYDVDLILLIGFLRILSAEFCSEWRMRILNVHPSLLPKYAGGMDTNVHEEVIKNGDRETGCTIHFVTEDVDDGPILIQKQCVVEMGDSAKSLKTKVQILEGEAFIEAIKLIQNNIDNE